MSKAMKQTLAALGSNQAVVVGKEAPAKQPKGSVLLQFGKTYALQREANNVIEVLPAKITQAVKAIVEIGGVISAKVAKASGLDHAALLEKLQNNKAVTVTVKGKNQFSVTPKAKRANLLQVGAEAPVAVAKTAKTAKTAKATKPVAKPAAKAAKAQPAKAEKKAKEAPKPAKATKVAAKTVKAPAKAPKAAAKAVAPKGKTAKASPPAPKGKAKVEAPKKGKKVEAKAAPAKGGKKTKK